MTPNERPDPLERVERIAGEVVQGAQRLADRLAPPEERDLIRRTLDLSARKKVILARRLWRDPRVRRVTRMPMMLGTIYMLLPIRLLPMRFAALRPWEKLVGLGLVLWLIARITPEDVLREHLDAVERPGRLRRMFGREQAES